MEKNIKGVLYSMIHTWLKRLQNVSNLPKMYISENSKGFLLGSSAMRFLVR